ncbi:MAG: DNA alkylation repair protein [Chlamydiota bacterium]|nr:DNA alkylation repair protein [Chlamydiota bacterium]
MGLKQLQNELKAKANSEKARVLMRFFKTGPGEYAEGDQFLGVVVPESRKLVKKYQNLLLRDCTQLIHSPVHEERLIGLLLLVNRYNKASQQEQSNIYETYLRNTTHVNNWDLVDLTAPHIVGRHLFNKPKQILYTLARSKNLWERRIAILASFYFIKRDHFNVTCDIAKILLKDEHDLIHKAVGWMLREIGKRNMHVEEDFINRFGLKMPRTMLRYAIEKFPERKRRYYLLRGKD